MTDAIAVWLLFGVPCFVIVFVGPIGLYIITRLGREDA